MKELSCPIPLSRYPRVTLAHGGGGRLMNELIREMFFASFGNPALAEARDSSILHTARGRLAFTTDSYVVSPFFFPGGDIGSLAVYGTVNDLAMSGARPLYLSLAFILEEGLRMEDLWRLVQSISAAAKNAAVQIVTGDTKVVDRGKGDGIFINMSGIGIVEHELDIAPQHARPGDCILVSGDIGRHGVAIMSAREGLEFECEIESDSAPLFAPVKALLDGGIVLRSLRDPTRGGVATALVEISEACGYGLSIDEGAVSINPAVQGACEILGLDPLYVANEGRFIAVVPAADTEPALAILKSHDPGAARIGVVQASPSRRVIAVNPIGTSRVIEMLSGEQLPRICSLPLAVLARFA